MRHEVQGQRKVTVPACFVARRLFPRGPAAKVLTYSISACSPQRASFPSSSQQGASSSIASLPSSSRQKPCINGSDSVHHLSYLRAVCRHLSAFFTTSPLLSRCSLLHHCIPQTVLSLCASVQLPYALDTRRPAMASNNAGIPLHCNICPKRPNFSDVSHLLTHIASKGHLSNYYKVKVRSSHEDASRRIIDAYDQWYAEWGVEELMSERMNQKDKRRSRARPAGMAFTLPGVLQSNDHD
jgi:hypothetical protein